jgi:hypothetical protein
MLFFICLPLCLAGCAIPASLPTPPSEGLSDVSTIAASRIPPTLTPQPTTQFPSITPNTAPAATITSTGSSTTVIPQPTATNILVLIPTPPGDDVTQQVLWLFETNNGCQLPCWWGIMPGQTEWSVAEEFLNRFDRGILGTSFTPGLEYYGASIPLPTEVFAEDRMELGISARNGIVELIDTRVSMGNTPPGYLTQYTLPTFLTTYGQPAEVWLSTYFAPFEHNELPFRLVLFYPDQGIAALYSDNGVKQGDVVRGCPQQGPASFLSLWDPTQALTFEEVKNGAAVFNVDFLLLEESTGMAVSAFYEAFKKSDNTTCLETPANLWR